MLSNGPSVQSWLPQRWMDKMWPQPVFTQPTRELQWSIFVNKVSWSRRKAWQLVTRAVRCVTCMHVLSHGHTKSVEPPVNCEVIVFKWGSVVLRMQLLSLICLSGQIVLHIRNSCCVWRRTIYPIPVRLYWIGLEHREPRIVSVYTWVIISLPSKSSKTEAERGRRWSCVQWLCGWYYEFWLVVFPQGLSAPWIWDCHPQAPGSAAYQCQCRCAHTYIPRHTSTHTHMHPPPLSFTIDTVFAGFVLLSYWHYFPLRHTHSSRNLFWHTPIIPTIYIPHLHLLRMGWIPPLQREEVHRFRWGSPRDWGRDRPCHGGQQRHIFHPHQPARLLTSRYKTITQLPSLTARVNSCDSSYF